MSRKIISLHRRGRLKGEDRLNLCWRLPKKALGKQFVLLEIPNQRFDYGVEEFNV